MFWKEIGILLIILDVCAICIISRPGTRRQSTLEKTVTAASNLLLLLSFSLNLGTLLWLLLVHGTIHIMNRDFHLKWGLETLVTILFYVLEACSAALIFRACAWASLRRKSSNVISSGFGSSEILSLAFRNRVLLIVFLIAFGIWSVLWIPYL